MRKCLLIFILLGFFIFHLSAQDKKVTTKKLMASGESKNINYYSFKIIAGNQNTYGYNIIQQGKVIIHQPNIPGLRGNKGFNSKPDAAKVAALVIDKMKNNIMPPTISKEELGSLQIINL